MSEPVMPVAVYPTGLGIYEILPGLYQSGVPETNQDWDLAWSLADIVVSLECAGYWPGPDIPTGKLYIAWNIDDGPVPNLETLAELDCLLTNFIQGLGRKVLIHCAAGVNRSGLLTARIVRSIALVSGRSAAEHVRSKRPGALINPQFNDHLNNLHAI